MKFLRAWWLQILGVLVVLGFLGWLALAGGSRGVAHVSASATPSPTLSATQAIEQTVKDFVVAYDESAKTEDPTLPQSFTVPRSPAEGEATLPSDWTKQNGEAFLVDQRSWSENSWVVSVNDQTGAATVKGNLTESGHWVAVPGFTQKEAEKTFNYSWSSSMTFVGGQWKISDFHESSN